MIWKAGYLNDAPYMHETKANYSIIRPRS